MCSFRLGCVSVGGISLFVEVVVSHCWVGFLMNLDQSDLVEIVIGTNLSPGQLILGVCIIHWFFIRNCEFPCLQLMFHSFHMSFHLCFFSELNPTCPAREGTAVFFQVFLVDVTHYFIIWIFFFTDIAFRPSNWVIFALFSQYSWIFMVCCCKIAVIMVVL